MGRLVDRSVRRFLYNLLLTNRLKANRLSHIDKITIQRYNIACPRALSSVG